MSPERRVFLHDRPARILLYLAVGAGFCASALFAAQAVLLSSTVHRVFRQEQTRDQVLPLLAWMLGFMALRAGLIWAQEVLAQRSASRVKGRLRQKMLAHIVNLGPAYTRSERSGELVTTAVQGVEALDDYLTQFVPARYLAVLAPALVFLLVLLLDPWTSLVLLIAGPMLILLLAVIGGQAQAITRRRFNELSWMSAFYLDILQGLATLKLFGRSQEQAATIEEISQRYGKTTMEVLATAFQSSLVMEWAATAATAMVALEASLRLMNGALPFDRALAVLLLTPEFFLPLRQAAIKYHFGAAGKTATERVYAVLDTPAPPTYVAGGQPIEAPQAVSERRDDIRFETVSFEYPAPPGADSREAGRPAVRELSLKIGRGEMLALVGPTGAGKSTVASLLLRFIEPGAGRITVGGRDLAAIDRATWRREVAWVPQLPYLFHGSVTDNIRLARPEAEMAEVIEAARASYADEFIRRLPHGYKTVLGERGAGLSGGQARRLAIARAFLKDAPILILDEATAHLDARSEALIADSLTRLMTGRTVLIIAHRLDVTRSADQVAVMENGRVIESGTPETLLAAEGLYARLIAAQSAQT